MCERFWTLPVVAEFARHTRVADGYPSLAAEGFGVPSASGGVAPEYLGGYSRLNAEELEGCYICFRSGFSVPNLITAYVVVIRWDEADSCLTFEEQGRADAAHTQRGRVYIPDGRPFMSLPAFHTRECSNHSETGSGRHTSSWVHRIGLARV
jgi:hypothetical protein